MSKNQIVRFGILLALICVSALESRGADLAVAVNPTSTGADPLQEAIAEWMRTTTEQLNAGSAVVSNAHFGPIEYSMKGKGPIVLCLHGGPGGYDQSVLIGEHLIADGFTVLGVSRPGYLRTPLLVGTNDTAALQADEMIALLDALGIQKTAVLGFSAGSLVAFQMALNHSDRVSALVMEGIGAQAGDTDFYGFLEALLQDEENIDATSFAVYDSLYNDEVATRNSILSKDTDLTGVALQHRADFVAANENPFYFAFVNTLLPLRLRRDGLANDINGVYAWTDYENLGYLSRVNVPTIIIQSRNDTSGNFPQAARIATQIPGTQLLPLDDTGHFCWLGRNTLEWEAQLAVFLRQATAARLAITFQPDRKHLGISWSPAGGSLQSSESVSGPWSNVGIENPALLPATPIENRFYRVLMPE